MKFSAAALLTVLSISTTQVASRPIPFSWSKIQKLAREVPQEHSHEKYLTSVRTSLNRNNPLGIVDPVFCLLGNAAAAAGKGKVTDVECLQLATADQAFSNAKTAGDIQGMADALIFRTLERNTGAVGLQSNQCTSIKAVNPEIAALKQHQDPASSGAAATNKAIALELAKQLASIGSDPQQAIDSGTFAPGQIGDPTGKGHTCDDANDPVGCIFTQNLLVPDVTADEINAAVGGSSASSKASGSSASSTKSSTGAKATDTTSGSTGKQAVVTVTKTVSVCAATSTSSPQVTKVTTTAKAIATSASSTSTSSSTEFGSCPPPLISASTTFSDHQGLLAFEPTDETHYSHGSALDLGIIEQFVCDTLLNKCGLKQNDPGHQLCLQAQQEVGGGKGDASLADKWNKVFGVTTTFGKTLGSTSSGSSSAAATTTASSTGAASTGSTTSTSASSTNVAVDLGSCSNPEIEFGKSFDGRTENAFEITKQISFNHGSADNIAVLTGFICQQLSSACKAPQATLNICSQAQKAAGAVTGGKSADVWNSFFGSTTNFATDPVDTQA